MLKAIWPRMDEHSSMTSSVWQREFAGGMGLLMTNQDQIFRVHPRATPTTVLVRMLYALKRFRNAANNLRHSFYNRSPIEWKAQERCAILALTLYHGADGSELCFIGSLQYWLCGLAEIGSPSQQHIASALPQSESNRHFIRNSLHMSLTLSPNKDLLDGSTHNWQ